MNALVPEPDSRSGPAIGSGKLRRWPWARGRLGALAGWFLLGWLASAPVCLGQRALNWRSYRLADALPESACMAVSVSPQGQVVVRHLNLPVISQLDGYHVMVLPAPELGKSRVYQSPGGQFWTALPDGLQEFRQGAWVSDRVAEMAAAATPGPARLLDPVPICPIKQGVVLVLLSDCLLECSAEEGERPQSRLLREARQTQVGKFTGLTTARDGGLWISGSAGLAKVPGPLRNLRPDSPWHEYVLPPSLQIQNLQAPHEDEQGGVIMLGESTATNQPRLVVSFDEQHWHSNLLSGEKLRQVWRAADRTLWGMSTLGLFVAEAGQSEWTETEDISARQYFDVGVEPGGAFWLATSDGLFRYTPLTWRAPAGLPKTSAAVHALATDPEGRLWFIAGSALHLLQQDQHREFSFPSKLASILQGVRAIFPAKSGALLLDCGEQVVRFEPRTGVFSGVRLENSGPLKVLGMLPDGTLWVQNCRAPQNPETCALESFDGLRLAPLAESPPRTALGTNLWTLFAAQNGDLWLGGDAGVACYHERKWRSFSSTDRSTPQSGLAFAELVDGRIWCATSDQIWEFDGRNWSVVRGGFDRISALQRTRDGTVWVGCNNGLHRFSQGAWLENGVEEGLPSAAVRELCEDVHGRLWAGTIRGISLYHPEADPDPPQTTLANLNNNGNNLAEGEMITVSFSGEDKWKVTPRERLLYSYRLDKSDWSAFGESTRVTLSDLSPGKHYFQVRAMDRNGNIEPKPAHLEFAIVLPWYKEMRLVLVLTAGLGAALFFAGLAFNRHRQLLRSYAEVEQKVAERTRQLEMANRELLHSQKMNALGTLAAGIAHDFNNILSIIKGSAQIIEDNLENPEKVRTRADRIKTVVEQGAGIVKAMLGFSRESGEATVAYELNRVVDDTMKLLGDRFLREVQVRFEPGNGLPAVVASRDFIQQILLNFIFNAAESMSRNKQIIVSTRLLSALPPADQLVLTPAPGTGYVAVQVQDFGSGISAEHLPRIFEPFFTTKAMSSRRGTGLGLSMVYELAKRMGAGLSVDTSVGQGSTFALVLPINPVAPKPAAPDLGGAPTSAL